MQRFFGDEESGLPKHLGDCTSHATDGYEGLVTLGNRTAGSQRRLRVPPSPSAGMGHAAGAPLGARAGTVGLTRRTLASINLIFDCILVNYPCSCILTALFTAVKQNVCIANGKDSNFSYVYPK